MPEYYLGVGSRIKRNPYYYSKIIDVVDKPGIITNISSSNNSQYYKVTFNDNSIAFSVLHDEITLI